jgi:hypothetical protein
MNEIEKHISEKNYDEAIQACMRNNLNNLGLFLSNITNPQSPYIIQQFQANIKGVQTEGKIIEEIVEESVEENPKLLSDEKSFIRVKLLTNWTSPENIREIWNKMSQGNYTWNNIQIVLDDDPDYFVVLTSPPAGFDPDPAKTIVFRMEPFMEKDERWGKWSSPDADKYFKVCYHKTEYNNLEWHLSKTYTQLKTEVITKNNNIMSTVLSSRYRDTGHIKRIDFVKYLERKKMNVDVFGFDNKWGHVNYKGSLPSLSKDDAMFPYKYVFNVENNSVKNYFTEKLVDGILAECLVFYSGCYNVKEFIDERAFVYLELSNFENDYNIIKNSIENNLWEERLPYIKEAKKKILDYLQMFPRLERIINKTEDQKYIG